jgi:hypothetical protein
VHRPRARVSKKYFFIFILLFDTLFFYDVVA